MALLVPAGPPSPDETLLPRAPAFRRSRVSPGAGLHSGIAVMTSPPGRRFATVDRPHPSNARLPSQRRATAAPESSWPLLAPCDTNRQSGMANTFPTP